MNERYELLIWFKSAIGHCLPKPDMRIPVKHIKHAEFWLDDTVYRAWLKDCINGKVTVLVDKGERLTINK